MSKTIVVSIQPFVLEQYIYLFSNDALVMQITAPMQELAARVVQVAETDEVETVNLRGDVHFAGKIKLEIQEQEVTKYGANKLEINLV